MDPSEFSIRSAIELTDATKSLTDREKHLIGLVVSVTRGCTTCTGNRIEKSLGAGIPYESVRAAIDLAAAVNAGVTLRTAIEGYERIKSNEACHGAECDVGIPR